MNITKTTEGLIKAAVNMSARVIAGKNAKKLAERPKFAYEPDGYATHGKKYLSEEKRAEINVLLARYKEAETDEQKKEVLGLLAKEPIQLVPVKREIRIDRARYSGERMREISAAGGGARERSRRLTQMNKGSTPVAVAA